MNNGEDCEFCQSDSKEFIFFSLFVKLMLLFYKINLVWHSSLNLSKNWLLYDLLSFAFRKENTYIKSYRNMAQSLKLLFIFCKIDIWKYCSHSLTRSFLFFIFIFLAKNLFFVLKQDNKQSHGKRKQKAIILCAYSNWIVFTHYCSIH